MKLLALGLVSAFAWVAASKGSLGLMDLLGQATRIALPDSPYLLGAVAFIALSLTLVGGILLVALALDCVLTLAQGACMVAVKVQANRKALAKKSTLGAGSDCTSAKGCVWLERITKKLLALGLVVASARALAAISTSVSTNPEVVAQLSLLGASVLAGVVLALASCAAMGLLGFAQLVLDAVIAISDARETRVVKSDGR